MIDKSFGDALRKMKEEKSKIVHKKVKEEETPPVTLRSDHTEHRPLLNGYKGHAHKQDVIRRELNGL